jgi:hypothetical protein
VKTPLLGDLKVKDRIDNITGAREEETFQTIAVKPAATRFMS